MATRKTFERLLRDDDDTSGQSIRQWAIIEEEPGCFKITDRADCEGAGWLMLRRGDIPLLIQDLQNAIQEER